MNAAQWLITAIGLVAGGVTFGLLRYPQTRREQFRMWGPCSIGVSVAGGLMVLGFTLVLAWLQGQAH